jgi:2-polyprenyl-3-methyl-5-hydroxy-6-metoxy-1,4-benzoquinol methylase
MTYVSPVLCEERLHGQYADQDSWTRVLLNEVQQAMDCKMFAYGLDLVEELAPGRGRVLDIGCGLGTFLDLARQRGWEVRGVEVNSWCVRYMTERGIPVFAGLLQPEDLLPRHYNCVALWTVLEHLVDPKKMVALARQTLVPGGVLLVYVPNIEGLVTRILHEKSATFSGDAHVNFFNAATLTRLLRDSGFDVCECETLITELGSINNHLSFEDPYFGGAGTVLDYLTPQFIHDRLLGSRLLVIAQAA